MNTPYRCGNDDGDLYVALRREFVTIPSYAPADADKSPMFLEKRVYQGSSGKVYPLPFIDHISEQKIDRSWDAVYLENAYISLMILPELGGRIQIGQDKTNGYDFFYRQSVIKPALVGLAGPWISGGVEFNWPQHHRPSTFMPADVAFEEGDDGSKTVWLSEHEPMNRMKGMHGVRLYPDRAYVELLVRLYNRTPYVQTFLWWANAAALVHDRYQSFFPEDVQYVADHAKRAMSEFPICKGRYYGVEYGPEKGLDWYKNIPVPTSYMAIGSKESFFGGYDHDRRAGLVHVANHHVSPGKKQWTWGNHPFGWAWDRNLSEGDGPYIELMAGVYTDNQPDFSFLQPGETKTFSQYWYPIQQIGIPRKANVNAAVSLSPENEGIRVGVAVTKPRKQMTIRVSKNGQPLAELTRDVLPGQPIDEIVAPGLLEIDGLTIAVEHENATVISYTSKTLPKGQPPAPATEPAEPRDIGSNDELYVTGLHLEQYRHATRSPEPYWREALRRDPGDMRCNNAIGLWHLRRGEFEPAREHFVRAIERAPLRNPTPYDGEPYYNLGNALKFLGQPDEAYDAFYKAVWNQAWQAAGYHALAEIDCARGEWTSALDHLERSLRANTENLKARDLRAIVLRRLGRTGEADDFLRETLEVDRLDFWAKEILGEPLSKDTQVLLDLALDYERAGFIQEGLAVLDRAISAPTPGAQPLVHYYRGYFHEKAGDAAKAMECYAEASIASSDYCFPSRLEEILILKAGIRANPSDAKAPYYLGNLFYDKKRHREAIELWQRSAQLDPTFAIVWRNLGIGYYNVLKKPQKARTAYNSAFTCDPDNARILFERDQLAKRTAVSPRSRLQELAKHPQLVRMRDDLSVELCALYNRLGLAKQALAVLTSRNFQPWEGGEGQALAQFVRANFVLGREALANKNPEVARNYFLSALNPPDSLGEKNHLLANQSDVWYWLGKAYDALGDTVCAQKHWTKAADFTGDFQEMAVLSYSEMTYYRALALRELSRTSEARFLLRSLLTYAAELASTKAKIDYFATSLPTMLIFDDDIQLRQEMRAKFLTAQALHGLGKKKEAADLLEKVLRVDPSDTDAAELHSEIGH